VLEANEPAPHLTQVDQPERLYEPLLQTLHVVAEEVLLYSPAEQLVQGIVGSDVNIPDVHCTHSDA